MTKRSYAIFTSAGNNTSFHLTWGCINPSRKYDVWVVYYGDNDEIYNVYSKYVDYIEKRKGSKFQNFYYIFQKHKEKLLSYDYIFIADDDIIITPENIELMFETTKTYNLWISQPSFKHESKISWGITKNKPHLKLAYTNFVEVNTPVICTKKLEQWMEKYDPILIGWGIDLLFIQVLGIHEKQRYAVLHNVSCINPHDSYKGGKRELTLIPYCNKRSIIWKDFAKKNGYKINYYVLEHSHIKSI